MSDKISTKAGVFESGDKDVFGVDYKNGRLISCRNRKLTEYSVAEGTEVICDRAFMNMSELRTLVLPSTIRAIGESAFSGCKSLADINIPDGVTEIRQATFRDTDALTALELPASVSEVEKFAFGRNLETLVVSSPDVKFDRYAFANVKDLKTLIVPTGSAEQYRSQLFDIRVKATVEEMESEPASLLDAFIDEPEKVTEEINQILKTNNMEEEKKKGKLVISFNGEDRIYTRLWFCAVDNDTFERGVEEEVSDLYEMDDIGVNPRDGWEFNILHSNDFTTKLLDEDGNDITSEAINIKSTEDIVEDCDMCYLEDLKKADLDIYHKYERILNCSFESVPAHIRKAWEKIQTGEVSPNHFFGEILKQVLTKDDTPGAFVAIDNYDEVADLDIAVEYNIEWDGDFDFNKLFIPLCSEWFQDIPAFDDNAIIDEALLLDIIVYDGKMVNGYASTDYKDRDEDEVDDALSEQRTETFGVVSFDDLD